MNRKLLIIILIGIAFVLAIYLKNSVIKTESFEKVKPKYLCDINSDCNFPKSSVVPKGVCAPGAMCS